MEKRDKDKRKKNPYLNCNKKWTRYTCTTGPEVQEQTLQELDNGGIDLIAKETQYHKLCRVQFLLKTETPDLKVATLHDE